MNPYIRFHWIRQHHPEGIAKSLKGLFNYKEIKEGKIGKNEGDIVIIGLEESGVCSIEEYLGYLLAIDRIEKNGIYTNIFFSDLYFKSVIDEILWKSQRA